MKRILNYPLPAPIRMLARRIFFMPIDTYEYITGKRPQGVPPKGKTAISHEDYLKQGERFLAYFQELAGLKPEHSILEAGCGTGRIALTLTRYVNEKGSYNGFDSIKSRIDWCNKNITAKYPNFRFQYIGYNTVSNKGDSGNFTFPYTEGKFDFVFVSLDFTHMMPKETEHYIEEISRVMKRGAMCMMSFFIINCESEDMMIKRPTQMNFPYNKGLYRLHSLHGKNKYVAYDEEWLLEKLSTAGLKMEIIKYGEWVGRSVYYDYEDLLVCRKM